jgi:hypothetical protein
LTVRINQLVGAAILSALIVTGCSEDSNRTDRIVVLDSWWSLDYAKNSCLNACANDPGPEVGAFFGQLAAQLASNTQCKGIQIVKYDGPNSATSSAAADTLAKPHKTLIVDYTPGSPKQAWGWCRKVAFTWKAKATRKKSQPAFAPSPRRAAQDSCNESAAPFRVHHSTLYNMNGAYTSCIARNIHLSSLNLITVSALSYLRTNQSSVRP